MIEALLVVLAGTTFVGTTAGVAWGRRRGRRYAESIAERRLATVNAQRDAAERRAREALEEGARLRRLNVAGGALRRPREYPERASARDAEELAGMVRGLTLIDDAVIADRSGLSLTREETRASADLAALAPSIGDACRALAAAHLPVAQVAFESFAAEHVCARPLTGRAEGSLLLVRTTSQRANPAAMDAVAHAAAVTASELAPSQEPATRGSTDRQAADGSHLAGLFASVEAELARGARGILLAADGLPLFSAAKDGPSAAARRAASLALSALQDSVARTLRTVGLARIELTLRDGELVTWSALAPRSRLAVVSFCGPEARSPARTDQLLAKLRRGLTAARLEREALGGAA